VPAASSAAYGVEPAFRLDLSRKEPKLRAVISQGKTRSSTHSGTIVAMAAISCFALLTGVRAAVPFTSATITKVENHVNYGQGRGAQSSSRPAVVSDVVKANNYLISQAESRAELQYPDGSLVRIGQNTVFSFDAASRTLTLEEGSLLFHIPKGQGGGTIKTPSLTAAITGTAGKVSTHIIAIAEGVIKLVPSGREVRAGEFARKNNDGSITIAPFDPTHFLDGKLVDFHGLMPGFESYQTYALETPQLTIPDLRYLEVLQRVQNMPSSIDRFFPIDRNRNRVTLPPPKKQPNNQRPGNY
jgi:hypothetical protein